MEGKSSQTSVFVKALVIFVISFVLGYCFNYFFFEKTLGLAFPIYVAFIVFGLFMIALYQGKKLEAQILWLIVPLIFFALMIFVRTSELLTTLNILACLLLLLLIAKVAFTQKLKNFFVTDYLTMVFLPFLFIKPFFDSASDLFAFHLEGKDKKIVSQIVKGILISLPILFVFFLLFSSADLVFQKYIREIFDFEINPTVLFRFILVVFVTFVFVGAYTYIFSKKEQKIESLDDPVRSAGQIEISIILGSVNSLFLSFIILQLTYLFSGEANISVQDFTYAEYARKGFFELIVVAVFSFMLLWGAEKFVEKKENGHSLVFKFLSSALIVQVILIMASAFKRLWLYESAYGFSTMRLYSHAFIIFLAVIFCSMLYKIYREKKDSAFIFRAFIAVVLFLGAMNILNPDAFIAQKNMERYGATGKLDMAYINDLSSDAMPIVIKGLDDTDVKMKEEFSNRLYWRLKSFEAQKDWQSLNLSRMSAVKVLKERENELSDQWR